MDKEPTCPSCGREREYGDLSRCSDGFHSITIPVTNEYQKSIVERQAKQLRRKLGMDREPLCPTCGDRRENSFSCPDVFHAQGQRKNLDKNQLDLIPPEVLIALGQHYTIGAIKYSRHNWRKGFSYSETYGSLLRHLFAWWAGEKNDTDTGSHHLTAVIWNAVTLLYFEMFPCNYSKFDDREYGTKEINL